MTGNKALVAVVVSLLSGTAVSPAMASGVRWDFPSGSFPTFRDAVYDQTAVMLGTQSGARRMVWWGGQIYLPSLGPSDKLWVVDPDSADLNATEVPTGSLGLSPGKNYRSCQVADAASGIMYVMGGARSGTVASYPSTSEVRALNASGLADGSTSTPQWLNFVDVLPDARSGMACNQHSGMAYILFGQTASTYQTSVIGVNISGGLDTSATPYSFAGGSPAYVDTSSSTWVPEGRTESAAVFDAAGSRIVGFGGRDSQGAYLADVFTLTFTGSMVAVWGNITISNNVRAMSGSTVVMQAFSRTLFVIAGRRGSGLFQVYNDVYALNLSDASPAWTFPQVTGGQQGFALAVSAPYDDGANVLLAGGFYPSINRRRRNIAINAIRNLDLDYTAPVSTTTTTTTTTTTSGTTNTGASSASPPASSGATQLAYPGALTSLAAGSLVVLSELHC